MKKLFPFLMILLFAACESPDSYSPKSSSSERKKPQGAPGQPPTYQTVPATDWNIQSDTSVCGTVHLTWSAQPNAVTYTIYDNTPRTAPCPALRSLTNELYYTLGPGCYWNAMHTYSVTIHYTWKDVGANIIYSYYSLPYNLTTGPITFNCP